MNRTLKRWLQWTVGVCLVLLITLLTVPVWMHPNQYRAPIISFVKGLTGRQLTIQGDVRFALFPNPELILRDLALADDPAFGADPMAQAQALEVGVRLLPLLTGRVEVDRAEVKGLTLRLVRDGQGRFNWEQSLVPQAGQSVDNTRAAGLPESAVDRLLSVSAVGVELTGATLLWQDRLNHVDGRLEGVELKTGPIHPGRPVAVTSAFRFVEAASRLNGRAEMKYQLRVAPGGRMWIDGLELSVNAGVPGLGIREVKSRFAADVALDWRGLRATWNRMDLAVNLWSDAAWAREMNLGFQGRMDMDLTSGRMVAAKSQLTVALKANDWPPAGVQARLVSDWVADPRDLSLALDDLAFEGPAGAKVKGALRLRERLSVVEGSLMAERFDFRALLIALGRTVPTNTEMKFCSGAEGEVDFVWKDRELTVSRLALGLDGSRVTGSMAVALAGPAVRFDWELDTLALERLRSLLPDRGVAGVVMTSGKAVRGEERTEAVAGRWPWSWLSRDLVIDGRLHAGEVTLAGGRFADLSMVLEARDGVMRLDPLSWSAYGGRMAARAVVDNRGDEPQVVVDHALEGVNLGPLFQEWGGWSGLDGVGAWMVHLEAQGSTREALTRSARGQAQLRVNDGVVSGMNVVGRIRHAHALFSRSPLPTAGAEETVFSTVTATAEMRDGVLVNADLEAMGSALRVFGAGQVDFVKRGIDYQLQADVVPALQGVASDVERYQGVTLPLSLRVPWDGVKRFEAGVPEFPRGGTVLLREDDKQGS
ncbi:MAG: AsmA family protein [Magnetococcales bacterium]|nr:AsmA family protein [Magnetococcales bacterium]